jgi:cytochrome c
MMLVRAVVICLIAVTASLLLARVHPFGDAGLFAAQNGAQLSTSIPPQVRELLANKCADCHSANTRTPVYGHFAPVSWLLERDIVEGRRHMNVSAWDGYTADQQQVLEAKIVQLTKSAEMPLPQYRMIHWSSRITPADLQTLTEWTHSGGAGAADASDATLAGDPARGRAVFEKRCTGCHSLTENREGPRLQSVYGRASADVAGFPYSATLKNAHIQWNEKTLDQWLADPDAFLPNSNMDFRVPKPQERADLIAWFKQAAKP